MGTLTLYELADERAVLDEWLEATEGELTPELEARLDALDEKIETKIERVGLFIRELGASATGTRVERDRLDARIRRDERAMESLKAYLKHHMVALGKTKVNGLLATVSVQRNSQPAITTVLAANELYAIPEAQPYIHREERVIYTLDRDRVLAAWKAQTPLPDAIQVELGSHIRVR